MAWTSLSFPFGSTLTSAKMTQLYDNITAQANGDAGSPNQQTAGIANSAVTRVKLPTATVSLAGSLAASSGKVQLTLNAYAFFPMIHCTDAAAEGGPTVRGHVTDGASADNPRFMLLNSNSGAETYDVDYRYINT